MDASKLKEKTRAMALADGADLVGVVRVAELPEHGENIARMVPSARSVVVVAAKHSLAAISSANIQVSQFDTTYTYNQAGRAALVVSHFLESEGFASAAVPAFLPLDMTDPKKGMRGEICLRRAAVRAGLGSYGENGLLVTPEFGAAVRLSAVLTSADIEPDPPRQEDVCDHCMGCVEACPGRALSGGGKINKKACGDTIFKFGFRYFQQFIEGLVEKPAEETLRITRGYELRELWQTFMTGGYYYCWQCQAQCPATRLPR